MSKLDKLKDDFKGSQGTFRYADFERLLGQLGYEPVKGVGKTGGSRRRFYNRNKNNIITLHEPHDGVMTKAMIKEKRLHLEGIGLL